MEIGDDLVRTYTDEEEEQLARNLHALLERIHRGDLINALVVVRLIEEFHAALFHNVRDHGGRMRSRGRGSEYLVFGPNRSAHRDQVPDLVRAALEQARRRVDELRDRSEAPDYESSAIAVAVTAQAEIVRIHPFEDGNGRSSRALTDHLLVALGLRPVPIEAVKSEYNECLNEYHRRRDIRPLVDLYLRLYVACAL